MINLQWELSVLVRAVAYPNLSGASVHVGLSQPQLSRIVARLERSLQLTLLDRAAKRKSAWTPMAFKLAEIYGNSARKLETEIQSIVKMAEPEQIRIGTLEGLSHVAADCCRYLLRHTAVRVTELDVQDLNVIEEQFLAGEFDLIFTSREPARRKFRYMKVLGYQNLEVMNEENKKTKEVLQVYSSFEYRTRTKTERQDNAACFVSNSLELRKYWIHEYGGKGIVPSELHKKDQGERSVAALLVGTDMLSERLWERVGEYTGKLF